MSEQRNHTQVTVTADEHTVATARVTTSAEPHGTARASFRTESGHIPTGSRSELVDAVLNLPAVQGSDHLEATLPLGDTESIARLRERTTALQTHASGSTVLVDAEMPLATDRADDRPTDQAARGTA